MFSFLAIIGLLSGCGAHDPDSTLTCPTVTEKEGRNELTTTELAELRQNCTAYDLVGLSDVMNETWYDEDLGGELMPSDRCVETLLSLANLSKEFEEAADADEQEQRLALVRGLHLISALPLKSDGLILGVEGTECAAITEDYLGAEITDDIGPDVVFEGFINETAITNVIEYTRKFHVATDKDAVASESNARITYTSAYRPVYPVDESGTLLHEIRHNEDPLFSDSSSHTDCDGNSCDSGIFGSYGTEMRYHDALIRGSGQTRLADGRYILDDYQIEYSLYYMCRVVQKKIKYPPQGLVEIYEGRDCKDFFSNEVRDEFLLEYYGFERS